MPRTAQHRPACFAHTTPFPLLACSHSEPRSGEESRECWHCRCRQRFLPPRRAQRSSKLHFAHIAPFPLLDCSHSEPRSGEESRERWHCRCRRRFLPRRAQLSKSPGSIGSPCSIGRVPAPQTKAGALGPGRVTQEWSEKLNRPALSQSGAVRAAHRRWPQAPHLECRARSRACGRAERGDCRWRVLWCPA